MSTRCLIARFLSTESSFTNFSFTEPLPTKTASPRPLSPLSPCGMPLQTVSQRFLSSSAILISLDWFHVCAVRMFNVRRSVGDVSWWLVARGSWRVARRVRLAASGVWLALPRRRSLPPRGMDGLFCLRRPDYWMPRAAGAPPAPASLRSNHGTP